MFHVKHSRQTRPKLTPSEIGQALRAQLEPVFAAKGLKDPNLPGRIERFGATLALWGAKANLTSDAGDPSLMAYHVLDSLMPLMLAHSGDAPEFDKMSKRGSLILDIGSGAGYPGLILAAASKANFILAEPRRKRAHYLEAAAAEMGLENVEVEDKLAEAIDPGDGFDFVTVKGVRVDHDLFAAAARVLKLGGMLVAYSSANQKFDLEAAQSLGLGHPIAAHYDLRRGPMKAELALATWLRV
jgi:16S rRNA (guanine527-N7)-methyltransferase